MEKSKVKINNEFIWLIASFVIGYAYAVYILGFGFVNNITDVRYISNDMLQHFLGWEFYRFDKWSWPLTLTDRLNYPNVISIVYTDSFPLLVIFLKCFSGLLPKIFIWHGIITILNCSLQFYAGSLIFRILRRDTIFSIIGGVFLLFSTAMTWRFFKHYTLTSHWLILFNLCLVVKPNPEKRRDFVLQLILIFLSLGIHAYIFFVLFTLSLALIYRHFIQFHMKFKEIFIRLLSLCCVFLGSYYFFGYFNVNGSVANAGFGFYSMNLNSLFNPFDYSAFLPHLPTPNNQYFPQDDESYQYLGLGIIFALGISIISCLPNIKSLGKFVSIKSQYFGLFLVIIILTLFSLSTVVTLNEMVILDARSLFDSDFFKLLFGAFRSSARLFWPVFYLITIFAILRIYDLTIKKSKVLSYSILIILLGVQVVDLKPLRDGLNEMVEANLSRPSWDSDFRDPFWQTLDKYKHIDLFVLNDADPTYPIYFKFGMLALTYNLTLDSFYYSRGTDAQRDQDLNDFAQGDIRDDTVYLFSNNVFTQVLHYITDQVSCREIDSYNVCVKQGNLK